MLPHSEACERNKEPILAVLRERLAGSARVLEIGSGTGQHAVHFARHLPHLAWQPTERAQNLATLAQRIRLEGGANLAPPEALDVRQTDWPGREADAVFTANTLHIMSWEEVGAMIRGIGALLPPGGVWCVYGPFRYGDHHTSPSNREFDRGLRARDPLSGLRDAHAVARLAAAHGLLLEEDRDLPAFNRLLIFGKAAG